MKEQKEIQEKNLESTNLFNVEAEQIVLGSIIQNNEYLNKVSEILLPVHFYEPVHQKIYEHILNEVLRSNNIADSITLKRFFETDETLKSIGGVNYLSTLLGIASGIFDIVNYAKEIIDLAIKRELVMLGENMVNKAYKVTAGNAVKQIEEAETELFKLGTSNTTDKGTQKISDATSKVIENTAKAMKRDSHISGIPTDFYDLDKLLGGLQKSDLLILAGRPSMGKTGLAVNIAFNAAKKLNEQYRKNPMEEKPEGVALFSLEMSSDQLAARMLAMETGINSNSYRTGDISQDNFDKVVEKANEISQLPIFLDDTPALSISAVRTRVRRMIRKHNISLVIVDYLQLLHGTGIHSQQNRVQEISEITQGLKAIAKEFNIPVLALSQLSRAVEGREDKRPMLQDLRESGSIEQDADVVMFIYREEYYISRKKPGEGDPKLEVWIKHMDEIRNKAELIIAKHRNGSIGTITLYFNPDITKFKDDAGHLGEYRRK